MVCLMMSIMRMGSGFRSMSEAEASEEGTSVDGSEGEEGGWGDGTTQGER